LAEKLTDTSIRNLIPPDKGNRITYDTEVKGLGCRVTSTGARAFVLNYRAGHIERRLTLGSTSDWTVAKARARARDLKRRIDVGDDPMGVRHDERSAPTMNDLADRFETEHLSKRQASTQRDYRSILRLNVRPTLGRMKVVAVRHADVDALHRSILSSAPYRANRTMAVISKMFSLAIRWEMRADNPAIGIERAPEERRERFLTPAEIAKLSEVMAAHPERQSANAVRLLLLTGARRNEVLSARWSHFDLAAGVWVKPAASTKQGKPHRVPLSAAALTLLLEMKASADRENARRVRDKAGPPEIHLFPGANGNPQADLKRFWASICNKARIEGVRVHDLRHTHASILASLGLSLPIIGALLGHTQASTTQRYAHLMDDPLRAATERLGEIVTGGRSTVGTTAVANQRS
jgi:integrase